MDLLRMIVAFGGGVLLAAVAHVLLPEGLRGASAEGAGLGFTSGGILYLIFHDIAPLAHQERHWIPTLGAILGFLVGLLGEGMMGGDLPP